MPETEHETGRRGVRRVQRLLEATFRFKLPYDVYQHPERTTLEMLQEGERKLYDLAGDHLDPGGVAVARIYVESKDLAGAGNQASEFKEFLARGYSATKRAWQGLGTDPRYEFMWATTSPWKGDGFRRVASKAELEKAIEDADDAIIPDGHDVDADVLDTVAGRFWVWVVSDKAEQMTMGAEMRGYVAQHLEAAE